MALINVIIPIYNRSEILKRAVESVINQSFKDFDIWIVNDGSTDNTRESADRLKTQYKNNIIHYIETSHRGVSAARNTGILNSDGKYIALLDSDDEWLCNKLYKQVEYMKNNKIEFVYSEEIWIRNGKKVNIPKKYKKYSKDVFIHSLPVCMIGASTVIFSRELFNRSGFFREDFPVCEDYDYWLRVSSVNNVGLIEEELIKKYGGHNDQLSRKYKAMDYWRVISMYSILNKYKLDSYKTEALKNEIIIKSRILLKGFKKYKNTKKYHIIKSILTKLAV